MMMVNIKQMMAAAEANAEDAEFLENAERQWAAFRRMESPAHKAVRDEERARNGRLIVAMVEELKAARAIAEVVAAEETVRVAAEEELRRPKTFAAYLRKRWHELFSRKESEKW